MKQAHKKHIIISFFLFVLCWHFVTAQEEIIIPKTDGELVFDGIPDEAFWDEVDPFPVVMFQPVHGNEPTEKTEIRLCYNDQYLLLSGRMYDKNPSEIQDNTKKRDEFGGNSDGFGIIIDNFNDNENAIVFSTTPSGLRADMTVFNDAQGRIEHMPFNDSWNTFWDVETVVNHEGWFAEIRIPISSIRFQDNGDSTIMGITVWRWIPHKNETIIFPAIHPKYGDFAMMKPSQTQKVLFEDIEPKKPLYIAPYALAGYTMNNDLNDAETEYLKESEPSIEAGLDIKYGLTSNLTLDLTVNTDFAQVEADDQQVNLTRFSLFFPEKRLFFQERSSIFSFSFGGPSNLFYSRRIGLFENEDEELLPVRIYGGLRVYGRAGKWDLGFLDMQTAPFDTVPSENFGVLRLRRQVINPYSYIGGIYTSRLGMDGAYNIAYGLDGIFRLFGDDYLDVKWAQSFETDSTNTIASMKPSRVRFSWERRSREGFGYDFSFSWAGEEFNPGMGFEMREDYYMYRVQLQYGWLPGENSRLYSHSFQVGAMNFYRMEDGSLESARYGPAWSFTTKSMMQGRLSLSYNLEDVDEEFEFSEETNIPIGKYEFFSATGFLMTPMSRSFYTLGQFELGQFYDGTRFSLTLTPTWNINSSVALSGMYQINRLDFKKRNQEYLGHIGQLKLLYMFSTKLSASAFIQYNSEIEAIISNFRLRYNPREGNDFYIVYNEGTNTFLDREDPVKPRTGSRTLLLKYTYTFSL